MPPLEGIYQKAVGHHRVSQQGAMPALQRRPARIVGVRASLPRWSARCGRPPAPSGVPRHALRRSVASTPDEPGDGGVPHTITSPLVRGCIDVIQDETALRRIGSYPRSSVRIGSPQTVAVAIFSPAPTLARDPDHGCNTLGGVSPIRLHRRLRTFCFAVTNRADDRGMLLNRCIRVAGE